MKALDQIEQIEGDHENRWDGQVCLIAGGISLFAQSERVQVNHHLGEGGKGTPEDRQKAGSCLRTSERTKGIVIRVVVVV